MPIETITIAEVNAEQGFAPGEVAITSTANVIAWDCNVASRAVHTLTENTTLQNPTNMVAGETYHLRVIQHASAAKTMAYDSAFLDSTDLPVISAVLGAVMNFRMYSDGTKMYVENYSVDESA